MVNRNAFPSTPRDEDKDAHGIICNSPKLETAQTPSMLEYSFSNENNGTIVTLNHIDESYSQVEWKMMETIQLNTAFLY